MEAEEIVENRVVKDSPDKRDKEVNAVNPADTPDRDLREFPVPTVSRVSTGDQVNRDCRAKMASTATEAPMVIQALRASTAVRAKTAGEDFRD